MAGFSFTIDDRDMREVQRQLAAMPNRIPQAIAASLNAALSPSKRSIVRGIVKATTLPRAKAIENTHEKKASKGNLVAAVTFTRRPSGAINFRHRLYKRTKRLRNVGGGGAGFQFFRDEPMVFFRFSPRVFKATGKSNNTHLFFRKGKPRLPIKTVYGPSLATIVKRRPAIIAEANKVASEAFRKRLYSQIDRFLQRTKTTVPALDSLT